MGGCPSYRYIFHEWRMWNAIFFGSRKLVTQNTTRKNLVQHELPKNKLFVVVYNFSFRHDNVVYLYNHWLVLGESGECGCNGKTHTHAYMLCITHTMYERWSQWNRTRFAYVVHCKHIHLHKTTRTHTHKQTQMYETKCLYAYHKMK